MYMYIHCRYIPVQVVKSSQLTVHAYTSESVCSLYRRFSRRGRRNSRDRERDTTESTDSPRGRSKSGGGAPPRPPPPSAEASLKYATESDQKETSNGE